jgi:hypothetical protein
MIQFYFDPHEYLFFTEHESQNLIKSNALLNGLSLIDFKLDAPTDVEEFFSSGDFGVDCHLGSLLDVITQGDNDNLELRERR